MPFPSRAKRSHIPHCRAGREKQPPQALPLELGRGLLAWRLDTDHPPPISTHHALTQAGELPAASLLPGFERPSQPRALWDHHSSIPRSRVWAVAEPHSPQHRPPKAHLATAAQFSTFCGPVAAREDPKRLRSPSWGPWQTPHTHTRLCASPPCQERQGSSCASGEGVRLPAK